MQVSMSLKLSTKTTKHLKSVKMKTVVISETKSLTAVVVNTRKNPTQMKYMRKIEWPMVSLKCRQILSVLTKCSASNKSRSRTYLRIELYGK